MFGERYFTARGRLAGVMAGIGALAAETGTELTDPGELADGLGPPFVFVVCGEVNAGKSALFNGLFGHDLCPMNKLPETKVVAWYQWGPAATEVAVVPLLEERYRPLGFLRDFHLIDTPGINSAVVGHQQITDRLLPVAELVMFVLPVSNPWGAVTWNVISRLPAAVLE